MEHNYYAQMQGQMFFSKRKICNLVIWIPKKILIFRVLFSQRWADENVPKVLSFYVKYFVPYVWKNCVQDEN